MVELQKKKGLLLLNPTRISLVLFFIVIPGHPAVLLELSLQRKPGKNPANGESVCHKTCQIPFILMIPLSLPLKLCFAAVVWPLSLCLSGVISSHSLLTASPCMVSHAKASAKNSISFLLMYLQLPVQTLGSMVQSVHIHCLRDVSAAHSNLITPAHGFVGYSGKILPGQRGLGLGFEFSFPGTNPVVTAGQQGADAAVPCAPPHMFLNHAAGLSSPTANGGLPVSEGKTFLAGSGAARGSCKQWKSLLWERQCTIVFQGMKGRQGS